MRQSHYIIAVMACVLCASVLISGCADDQGQSTSIQPTVMATATPTATPAGPVLIIDPALPDFKVDFSAKPIESTKGVLVTYTIDATGMGNSMSSEGDGILLTAFAYNPATMSAGFSPGNYDDVRNSGIAYESRSIRVYPGNVYNDKIAVNTLKEEMPLDSKSPYNYGLILTLSDY